MHIYDTDDDTNFQCWDFLGRGGINPRNKYRYMLPNTSEENFKKSQNMRKTNSLTGFLFFTNLFPRDT